MERFMLWKRAGHMLQLPGSFSKGIRNRRFHEFRKFWAEAEVEERVELLEGPALSSLSNLIEVLILL